MATGPITAFTLIDGIKRRAMIPENQATFSDQDFLAFADEELMLGIFPSIMMVHGDYFVYELKVPLVQFQTEYEIPYRAAGNKLKDLFYCPNPKTRLEMNRIDIGDRIIGYNAGLLSSDRHFYVKNNRIVVSPNISNNVLGTLAFVFYMRPSSLVLEDEVGVIQSITDLGNGNSEIVLNAIPTAFTTTALYDFYKGQTPNCILNYDFPIISLNTQTNSIVVSNQYVYPHNADNIQLPTFLKVGDNLALAGQTTIAQMPAEFSAVLEQMVACRVLEALGDTQGLQNALLKLKSMNDVGTALVENRVDNAPLKVVPKHSLLRTTMNNRRFLRR